MHSNLTRNVAIFREIKDRIASMYDLDADDEAVIDTATGETDIEEAIAAVVRKSREAEANAKAMSAIIEDNEARKARHLKTKDSLRALAAWALNEAGLSKVTAPDLTISVRVGAPKMIIEEGALAAQFLREIITTKPDKEKIQAAIDAGDVPNGVKLDNGSPILTVRAK